MTQAHVVNGWVDRALAIVDSIEIDGRTVAYGEAAEAMLASPTWRYEHDVHDWRYIGGDADYAKWTSVSVDAEAASHGG